MSVLVLSMEKDETNFYHFFNDFLNILPEPACFVDEQGIVKSANEPAISLFNPHGEKIIGKPIHHFYPYKEHIRSLLRKRTQDCLELIIGDGLYLVLFTPVHYEDEFLGLLIRYFDISEVKELREKVNKLNELNRELDMIIDGCSDGIYVTDGEGTTLRMNSACHQLTGLVKKKVLGKNVRDLVKQGMLSASVTLKVLETKQSQTIIHSGPNGKQIIVTGTPLFDGFGKIIRVVCNSRDLTELNQLKEQIEKERCLTDQYYSELVGLKLQHISDNKLAFHSRKMLNVVELALRVARTDSTVMITGESGVGKEVMARLIHSESPRKDRPFMKINCAAIPESLLESELFGYEKGAFTGANKEGKPGLIELANQGTFFLDEIGELPLSLQPKLLQVLQEKKFMRIGGKKSTEVDIRIIAATNRDLSELVKKGKFREDLFYRLNVIPIHIPPLRERREDIPPLISKFLSKFNRKYNLNKKISQDAVDVLIKYSWPGNVRELENMIERMVIMSQQDIIDVSSIPDYVKEDKEKGKEEISISGLMPLRQALDEVEKQLFLRAYRQTRNTYHAAKILGVSQSTVVRKLKKYQC